MTCKNFCYCLQTGITKDDCKCRACRKESNDQIIVCHENKRRYSLINDQRKVVINFLIDGGVVRKDDPNKKCDRLFLVHDENGNSVIFIELKGKKISHALEQLHYTADSYKDYFQNCRKYFRVVCSGAPKILNSPDSINLIRKIFKEFNSVPLIKENKIEEKYSKLNSKD